MKLNKAVIGEVVAELTVIGQSHLKIAEYLKTLAEDAPEIEEVLPPVSGKAKTPKAPKAAVIEPEEVDEDEAGEEEELDLAGMTLKELKALADENEIEYPSKVKKDALIELLEAAMEESDEDEEEVEEDEAAEDEEEEEEIDLEEMSVDELKSFIEENLDGVDVPKKKKSQKAADYKAALIELIEENLGEEEEEEDADEEVEADEDEDEVSTVIETEDGDVDLAELSLKELKKFAKDYEIEITEKKKEGIIEEILEAIYADDEDAEEADEEDDEDEEEVDIAEELGLNDMSTEELAEILEEYELSTKGKKQALIARIVEAVEDGTIEMDDEEEGE